MTPIKRVVEATQGNILSYAERIVPNGKLQGREYKMLNPTRADNNQGSFSINIDSGAWSDFAVDAKGGDVVSLYAYVNSCSQMEAAKAIAGWDGMEIETKKASKKFIPLPPVGIPDSFEMTVFIKGKWISLGKPSVIYKYIDGYILRYDWREKTPPKGYIPNDEKDFFPLNYGIYDGKEKWHFKQKPNNRPLYKLETLANSKACVIVEGEKACDALIEAAKGAFKVITWAGGANAIDKTDWTPIYGKGAILWADNDHTGIKAMDAVAKKLIANGCPVKMVDVSGMEHKEDAADWVQNHSHEELLQLIRSASVYEERIEHDDDLMAENPAEEKIREARPIDIDSIIGKRNQAPVVRTETEKDLPFFILGHADDNYILYSRSRGAIVRLPPDKISKSGLMHTHADRTYWENNFPALSRNGGKVDWDGVQEFIMKQCVARGYFDDSKIRSSGAWLDNGKIVVHLGDKIYMNGEFIKPSDVLSEYVYVTAEPIKIEQQRLKEIKKEDDGTERYIYESFIPEPLDDATAYKMYDLIRALRWEYKECGVALAGWIAIAVVGGALPWRPHIWITAQAGAGKTTVMNDIVGRLTGDMSEPIISGSTEAGLRRGLNNKTIPIIFDEAESETTNTAAGMERMLTLIRRSSANTRGKTKMAARAGSGTESFTSSSCFCLASIISTIKNQADASRFTILNLTKARSAEEIKHYNNVIQPMITELFTPENCDRFLMRSITNIESILHNIDVIKKVMAKNGMNGRQQDQYSAILSGAYLYKSSGKISEEEAKDLVDFFNFEVFEQEAAPQEQGNLFLHLLSKSVQVKDDPSATHRSVSWMIQRVLENPFSSTDTSVMPVKTAMDTLREIGINVCHKTQKVYFLRSSKTIFSFVKFNPQWFNWSQVLLDDPDKNFHKLVDKRGKQMQMRFGGLAGMAIYATFDFFRNGVSFEYIHSRVHQDEEEYNEQPF